MKRLALTLQGVEQDGDEVGCLRSWNVSDGWSGYEEACFQGVEKAASGWLGGCWWTRCGWLYFPSSIIYYLSKQSPIKWERKIVCTSPSSSFFKSSHTSKYIRIELFTFPKKEKERCVISLLELNLLCFYFTVSLLLHFLPVIQIAASHTFINARNCWGWVFCCRRNLALRVLWYSSVSILITKWWLRLRWWYVLW